MSVTKEFVVPFTKDSDCGDSIPIIIFPNFWFICPQEKLLSGRPVYSFAKIWVHTRALTTKHQICAKNEQKNTKPNSRRHVFLLVSFEVRLPNSSGIPTAWRRSWWRGNTRQNRVPGILNLNLYWKERKKKK